MGVSNKTDTEKRPVFPVVSLLLGILSIFAWLIPTLGLPITLLGLIIGVQTLRGVGMPNLRRVEKGMAVAAVVLCSLGLLATIGNFAYRAYLVVTGQRFSQPR